jgi:GNAT superfamily N-acetyltransferase
MPARKFTFHAATPECWPDVETLFGERGACGGCWCMAWRLSRAEFVRGKGADNRRALRTIIENEQRPGVLAYFGNDPMGWCAIAPRDEYVALKRSRVLAPVDEKLVWSISCLFVAKPFRRQGLSVRLIKEAVKFARSQGARIVEAYPVVPYTEKMPDAFAWTGLLAAYLKAGFREVLRRSDSRPILRRRCGR